MSECGGTEEDVASRIKKANGEFVQMYPVWRNLNISKEVEMWIFSTNVKSVLLYACETWKTTNQITRRLQILWTQPSRNLLLWVTILSITCRITASWQTNCHCAQHQSQSVQHDTTQQTVMTNKQKHFSGNSLLIIHTNFETLPNRR